MKAGRIVIKETYWQTRKGVRMFNISLGQQYNYTMNVVILTKEEILHRKRQIGGFATVI